MDDETRAAFDRIDGWFELSQQQHMELRSRVDRGFADVDRRFDDVDRRLGTMDIRDLLPAGGSHFNRPKGCLPLVEYSCDLRPELARSSSAASQSRFSSSWWPRPSRQVLPSASILLALNVGPPAPAARRWCSHVIDNRI
jgi:hypothetical protein